MQFKHSALFYTFVYVATSFGLYYLHASGDDKAMPTIYCLPFLYSLTLVLNFFLHQSSTSRPATMINAIMLSSLGRLLGFGGVIVLSVFLVKHAIVYTITTVACLYMISLGGDIFFVKRFKS